MKPLVDLTITYLASGMLMCLEAGAGFEPSKAFRHGVMSPITSTICISRANKLSWYFTLWQKYSILGFLDNVYFRTAILFWLALHNRWDSNPQSPPSDGDFTICPLLDFFKFGVSGRNRTYDTRLFRRVLYNWATDTWHAWKDLNPQPLGSKPSALFSWATSAF